MPTTIENNSATLALSQFAGELDLELSAGDSLETIIKAIKGKFDSLKPLELSAREKELTVSTRETRIQTLREKGVSPLITNKLTAEFCSGDLAFSRDESDFALCFDLVSQAFAQAVMLQDEKSGAQVKKQTQAETWAERTAKMQPLK